MDSRAPGAKYLAHAKPDPVGDGCIFVEFAPFRVDLLGSGVQAKRMAADGTVQDVGPAVSIDSVVHDWMPTPNFICYVQHSLKMSPGGLARAMMGEATLSEAMQIKPEAQGQLILVDRRGGRDPIRLPLRPLHFWHFVSAHEDGDRVVIRLAASASGGPDIGSANSPYRRLMEGREEWTGSPQNTILYRIEADVAARRLTYEGPDAVTLRGFEMPTVDSRRLGRKASCFYCMRGQEFLQTRIARGPLAVARLPFHLPVGFHGAWASR